MQLELGRCFEEAWNTFLKNWLVLIIAAVISTVLSVVTLFILAGPLAGGFCLLALNALQREDRHAELADLFKMFHRFFGLVGMFFMTFIAVSLGLMLLAVPGLYLMTIWMFACFILVDQQTGVFESLGRSRDLAYQAGFWNVSVLMLVELVLNLLPQVVPVAGILVSFVTAPVATLLVAAAYRQVTAMPSREIEPAMPAGNI